MSSSPVVAILSLPRPPPPPLPPLLADHDLGQRCEAPRRLPPSILHATPRQVCRVRQGQHCSRGHCLSTRSVFDFIFLGLAAHLLGNNSIHGLDIRTLLLSWQRGLRVLWQHLPRMHKEACSLLSAIIDLVCTPSFSKTC